MNKKKLLLMSLLIGLPQAYGSDKGKNSSVEKLGLEERKSQILEEDKRQIKKTHKSELGNEFDREDNDVFQYDQRKEGHVEIEIQREELEKEFLKLGKEVDILRHEENEIRENIVNLEKFKTFLEKKNLLNQRKKICPIKEILL